MTITVALAAGRSCFKAAHGFGGGVGLGEGGAGVGDGLGDGDGDPPELPDPPSGTQDVYGLGGASSTT